jgi:stress-induced morphogen
MRAVRTRLGSHFESVVVKPFLEQLIRVEIIDVRFAGLSFVERHRLVNEQLDRLGPIDLDRVGKVLLLAPGEDL